MNATGSTLSGACSAAPEQPAVPADPLAPRRQHRRKRIDDQAARDRRNERLARKLAFVWFFVALLALVGTLFPALQRDPMHESSALLKTAGAEAAVAAAFILAYFAMRVPRVRPGEKDDDFRDV